MFAKLAARSPAQATVKNRSQQPLDPFLELAVGQKVSATVGYVRTKPSSGAVNFALLRLTKPDVSGMLHCTQMTGNFTSKVDDVVEVWVRQVSPERREIVFTQHQVRLPGDALMDSLACSSLTPSEIAKLLGGRASSDQACKAAEDSMRLQGIVSEAAHPDSILSKRTAVDTFNRLIETLGLIDTPPIPAPDPAKGATYGDVAKELVYTLDDVVNAAGHMIGDPDTYQLGMAVLPAGFTPNENSAFPLEHKETFVRECRERADKNWSKQLDLDAALKPDCLSLSGLAKAMGISDSELLALMTEKGIQPKVQVVLVPDDIKKLSQ
jgi:hypothetical protein